MVARVLLCGCQGVFRWSLECSGQLPRCCYLVAMCIVLTDRQVVARVFFPFPRALQCRAVKMTEKLNSNFVPKYYQNSNYI